MNDRYPHTSNERSLPDADSTLIPMLVGGLVLIVIGMGLVMIFV